MKLNATDPLVAKLADVMFVVEATSFEQHCLWNQYHCAVDWKSDNSGEYVQLKEVDGRPVNLVLTFATLNGQKVMFTESVSQLADYKQIEDWLDVNCKPMYDKGYRIARTNGMNFHHCLHAITDVTGISPDYQEARVGKVVDEVELVKADAEFNKALSLGTVESELSAKEAYRLGWLAGIRNRLAFLRNR